MGIVFLNGEFMQAEDAKISVFDSGFYYGDGIYEVALLYEGRIVDLESHLLRLEYVLSQVKFRGVPSTEELKKNLHDLALENPTVTDGIIYLQITRGLMENRYSNPSLLETPTIVAYIIPAAIKFDINEKPALKCKLEIDPRRERRDIKMISLMPTVLSRISAYEENYDYPLFKDKITNAVTEGASSNIFIVQKNGVILTHPVSEKILSGCTRKKIIEILKSKGYTVEEKEFYEEDLLGAKEAFLSGAIKLFVPIESVNGNKIGEGTHEICSLCLQEYQNFARLFPQVLPLSPK